MTLDVSSDIVADGVAAVAAPKGVAPDCATDSNVIPAAIAPNSMMVFRIAPSSSDSIINDSHRAGRAFDPYQFDERSVEVTK
jgi:hypothetical protein